MFSIHVIKIVRLVGGFLLKFLLQCGRLISKKSRKLISAARSCCIIKKTPLSLLKYLLNFLETTAQKKLSKNVFLIFHKAIKEIYFIDIRVGVVT